MWLYKGFLYKEEIQMNSQSSRKAWLATFAMLLVLVTLTFGLGGCQIDVGGHVGTKLLYPEQIGETKLGDPRKPMYEGSGYTETTTTGGDVRTPGFKGMKVQNSEGGVQ